MIGLSSGRDRCPQRVSGRIGALRAWEGTLRAISRGNRSAHSRTASAAASAFARVQLEAARPFDRPAKTRARRTSPPTPGRTAAHGTPAGAERYAFFSVRLHAQALPKGIRPLLRGRFHPATTEVTEMAHVRE